MSTQYSNALQFNSEWANPITSIWLLHDDATDGGKPYFLTGLNLTKDGGDVPVPGLTVSSWSGVTDRWMICFLDSAGFLFGTDYRFTANIKNTNGPNDIEVTLSGAPVGGAKNTVVMTMQDGSTTVAALNWFGSGQPTGPG